MLATATLSVSPRAVHDLTKHTLISLEGQKLFSRKLVACSLDYEDCFKMVTLCVNYDTATEDYTRNDFQDPLDGLVMAAMQEFQKTWFPGNPWPKSRQQWAQAILPHLSMFFKKNPEYPQGFLPEALTHVMALHPTGPGDLDLIYDGLVDYVTGHRYTLLERQLSLLDPAAKKELLESTPRSIRVPGMAVDIAGSASFLGDLFGKQADFRPFFTGVNAFDRNYGQRSVPGDAWLVFANPGGGKTNFACQAGGVSADRGKKVLIVTTEVIAPTMLMRAFCAAKQSSYAGLRSLLGKSPKGNDQGEKFVAWTNGVAEQNLTIVDYRMIAGANFREKISRIVEAYYRKKNYFPELIILDWIGGSIDASFKDAWAKREAYEQIAVRMARLADELQTTTISLAQAKKECKNKAHLNDQDTADCSSLSQPMEGVLGITSLLETGGEQLNGEVKETHKNRQFWCICKCREEVALHIPVERRFNEMRFDNAG